MPAQVLAAMLQIDAYTRSRKAPGPVRDAMATLRAAVLAGELAADPADPLDLLVKVADACHERGNGWDEINERLAAVNLMNPDRRI
jgi:phage tail sheath gpL-like